jgi:FtsH-binding integral membrane protein
MDGSRLGFYTLEKDQLQPAWLGPLCAQIMNKNHIAILAGLLVETTVLVVCLAVLYKDSSSSIGFILWGALIVAGFTTALLASSHRIKLALVLAVPTALIFALSNVAWQHLGKPTDFPGAHGFLTVIGMTLPLAFVLNGVGGFLGWFLRKQRT